MHVNILRRGTIKAQASCCCVLTVSVKLRISTHVPQVGCMAVSLDALVVKCSDMLWQLIPHHAMQYKFLSCQHLAESCTVNVG